MYSDGNVLISNFDELNNYLKKYHCKTFNELSETLWYTYGVNAELGKKLKIYLERNPEYDI